MKTLREFIAEAKSEPLADSKGNTVEHGDYVHNPHTGDVATVDTKKKKLVYHDGTRIDFKRVGLKDWWHKIDSDEFNRRTEQKKEREAKERELKKHIKRLTK